MDFMKTARIWVAISVAVILIGFGSLAIQGLNLSIDFTGGTLLDLAFEKKDLTVAQVRQDVDKVTDRGVQVQGVGDKPGEFIIRTPHLDDAKRDALFKDLEAQHGKFTINANEEVAGSISRELTLNALFAVALASVLQIMYVAWRFDLKFGVTAVIAVIHDVLVTLGIVSLMQMEVSSAFVAAMLTILGYSINDTIVIFDRIRENLKLRKKGEALDALVNRSISQSLTRSIYTVLTVLMTLLAIVVFGGGSVRDFALTMFIGILSGSYSSIMVASALWYWWTTAARRQPKARTA